MSARLLLVKSNGGLMVKALFQYLWRYGMGLVFLVVLYLHACMMMSLH